MPEHPARECLSAQAPAEARAVSGPPYPRLAGSGEIGYTCNVLVAKASNADPLVEEVVSAMVAGKRAVLIAGAPGVGKTSVLAASAELVGAQTCRAVMWVNGGIVASEGHLVRLLSELLGTGTSPEAPPPVGIALKDLCRRLAENLLQPILLAVDDFDLLVFKREHVGRTIGQALAAGSGMRLLATCHPAARDRLVTTHAFGRCLVGEVATVTISTFDISAARELVSRRAPSLSTEECAAVVEESGGHPAALAYLSRLAELSLGGKAHSDSAGLVDLFERAAEFAGSVYAEPWAALGPQQRAILWQLGSTAAPKTAAEVAARLSLPAPQVSAQLTRLVDEGLVQRTAPRAHYSVSPLLARWIARRAVREHHHERGLSHG